ncbi:MAG: redoxin domain-containing protein [Acidimicrobiales bacterium]
MERAQLIAAFVVIVVVGALVAVRIGSGNETEIAADPTVGVDDAPRDASVAPDDEVSSDDPSLETTTQDDAGAAAIDAPENLGAAGSLRELDGWLQTDATSFEDFDGQVRIVQFWTFGCYNCRNTIPALQGIYERYRSEGLEIIGVHSPEFDREKEIDAIAAAAIDHGVTWPIALDTNKTNFRDWQPGRRFWPRTFVVDQNGDVRFNHIGEGRYDDLEATVAYLVENGP